MTLHSPGMIITRDQVKFAHDCVALLCVVLFESRNFAYSGCLSPSCLYSRSHSVCIVRFFFLCFVHLVFVFPSSRYSYCMSFLWFILIFMDGLICSVFLRFYFIFLLFLSLCFTSSDSLVALGVLFSVSALSFFLCSLCSFVLLFLQKSLSLRVFLFTLLSSVIASGSVLVPSTSTLHCSISVLYICSGVLPLPSSTAVPNGRYVSRMNSERH